MLNKNTLSLTSFAGTMDATLHLMIYILVSLIIFGIIYYLLEKFNKKIIKHIYVVLPLLTYIVIILKITILDRNYTVTDYYNFELFWSYRYAYRYPGNYYVFWQAIQNILLFVPLGYLLSHYNYKITTIASAIICFSLSVGVETYQFIAKVGLCEYDDIFNNTLGGILGIFLFYIESFFLKKEYKKSLLCTIPFIATIITAKLLLYSYR